MTGVCVLNDMCSGHGGFHPRPVITASSNVTIGGVGVARMTDSLDLHTNGKSTHGGSIAGGSSTVTVNGLPIARIGDAVNCGSIMIMGSSTVTAG